jgi:microcystin-dependent protein
MAEPFLSEIRMMSFSFAPKGWSFCNGQLLPINQNQALFSLLGTTFGGNGTVNFALPNLQGRTPIHVGVNHTLGERGGEQAHILTVSELPAHTHNMRASSANVSSNIPTENTSSWGNTSPVQAYNGGGQNLGAMNAAIISNVGGSQGHENRQPFLSINFSIALQGIFPSQN